MPRPHYRGAPAIWPDSYATQVLAPIGARLVPLEHRRFSSAPGGVVIVDTVVPEHLLQDVASVVMFAGPTQQLGGHVSVHSVFGEGTTFRVRLPLTVVT